MSTTNGLTKSVWAEFALHSGKEVFAITHAIYNPSYVEWLESELRAARQKIKEAEQTPTNSAMDAIAALVPKYMAQCGLSNSNQVLVDDFIRWARQQHQ